jgi:hypothetical protein
MLAPPSRGDASSLCRSPRTCSGRGRGRSETRTKARRTSVDAFYEAVAVPFVGPPARENEHGLGWENTGDLRPAIPRLPPELQVVQLRRRGRIPGEAKPAQARHSCPLTGLIEMLDRHWKRRGGAPLAPVNGGTGNSASPEWKERVRGRFTRNRDISSLPVRCAHLKDHPRTGLIVWFGSDRGRGRDHGWPRRSSKRGRGGYEQTDREKSEKPPQHGRILPVAS